MRASSFAVAAHVHPQVDLPSSSCQGAQTLEQMETSALELGFCGVIVTPHSSDPAPSKAKRFSLDSSQAEALRSHFDRVRQMNDRAGRDLRFFTGLETNILSYGTDASPSVLAGIDWVIASLHGEVPSDPEEVAYRFQMTCANPHVDALGHPTRYLADAMAVDWNAVLRVAKETGTAIELNFNLWYTYLKTEEQHDIHRAWLEQVADSGVLLLFSLDIHNEGMWPHERPVEDWSPAQRHVEEYFYLLEGCGIDFGRVVNREVGAFSSLCDLPKEARGIYHVS